VQEAATEGVNHDLAFCQMCLETNYLNFGGVVKPEQFNFADIRIISPTNSGISFPHARTGIRAQIQHLKAYGSTEPINQPLVQENVRFRFVKPGLAPTVNELAGRWNSALLYRQKIINTIRLLYETAGLLSAFRDWNHSLHRSSVGCVVFFNSSILQFFNSKI